MGIIRIAEHYGLEHQKNKLIEECAELIRALSRNDRENIIEELADVEILMEQVEYLMQCRTDVVMTKLRKIDRQEERMKTGK